MADDRKVTSLDKTRASRFLDALAQDPFLCIVVTENDRTGAPGVTIYSKGISEADLLRIKSVLQSIEKDGE
jgi:hypothetical protein